MLSNDTCYRCGSTDYGIVSRIDTNVSIVKCAGCSLARTYPYPQFDFESQEKYSNFYVENEVLFRRFARSMMGQIKDYKRSGAFLDIGCAVGFLLDEARLLGFEKTVGVELNKDAAQIARAKGHEVYTETIEAPEIGREAFDAISFNHVLEHIREFKPFLAKVRSLLKPDGIVYCGAPNYDSFMRRLLGPSWYGWGMPDHVWHFDAQTFRAVMHEAGFSPMDLEQNSLYYMYSKSLRKNTRATLARIAACLGLGDQVYGIFSRFTPS